MNAAFAAQDYIRWELSKNDSRAPAATVAKMVIWRFLTPGTVVRILPCQPFNCISQRYYLEFAVCQHSKGHHSITNVPSDKYEIIQLYRLAEAPQCASGTPWAWIVKSFQNAGEIGIPIRTGTRESAINNTTFQEHDFLASARMRRRHEKNEFARILKTRPK